MSGKAREPAKAKELLREVKAKIAEKDLISALVRVEEAIDLDQAVAINDEHGAVRVLVHKALGNTGPEFAFHFYNEGSKLSNAGQYNEARDMYLKAIALDTRFLWPLNNLAWILATAPDSNFRNGLQAREYALTACELSHWNYWPYLGTMAAASARCGFFEGAARMLLIAKDLAEPEFQEDLDLQLAECQQGKAHIDFADKVVAGEEHGTPDGRSVQ